MILDYVGNSGIAVERRGLASSAPYIVKHSINTTAVTGLKMAGSVRADAGSATTALPAAAAPALSDELSACTSMSMTTALIILLASIVGTALISSTATWVFFRRRYARYLPGKKQKREKEGEPPTTPGSPHWETWARGTPKEPNVPDGQPSAPAQLELAVQITAAPQSGSETDVSQSSRPESGALPLRRRPEYASGLSSTFMFPRRETGVTVTIMSDAITKKKSERRRKLQRRESPEMTTTTATMTKTKTTTDPAPEEASEAPEAPATAPQTPGMPSPAATENALDIGSTERLVLMPDEPQQPARTRPSQSRRAQRGRDRAASGSASSSQPPPQAKSAIEALRERLQASHAAAAAAAAATTSSESRTEPPVSISRAPSIPKRSSMRASTVPPPAKEATARTASPDDEPSGFPENSIHIRSRQQPFASLIQPQPQPRQPPPVLQRPQQREQSQDPERPVTRDNDEDEPQRRPSTSDTMRSLERTGSKRTPRRARKGTLVMFPKIQDGPPASIAAGLSISLPSGGVGKTDPTAPQSLEPSEQQQEQEQQQQQQQQQEGQEQEQEGLDQRGRQDDGREDAVLPPRRSYGPNWPFKPA
ncbi:uncharacterized protein B0I36DRAFT_427105 [Microdochium trichocladiopsis]|uniref:Uncharacterized protein n=1 Tax=Microdochium trichocladiopsis TaxID=1682393 RepID=A0A9P8YI61_9PEZI|nr:uncharacterized protein B0I36DRAFT_427105 [Microdochium trichocladiopsis]KAH7040730.1 hypothetical protein B0I36DRAFT_427105 [Microdochium trichocladiopsis]